MPPPPPGWHPGYAAGYGPYAPFAPAPPAPVGGLGQATMILLAVVAAGEAVQAVISLAGGSTTPLFVLNDLLVLAIAPVFMAWFYRVRKNAGLWGPQSRAQGWTIGAWFTPVVNLWFPIQIMRDAWRVSTQDWKAKQTVARLAGVWWAFWILSWLTGITTEDVTTVLPDGSIAQTHQARAFLGSTAASSLCMVVAAVFMALVVVKVTRLQELRIAGRG